MTLDHQIAEVLAEPEVWTGCYDGSWKGHITPDSFAHPAKMAYGLLDRILRTGLERGWFAPGDTIVDPFGGICTTGILGAYHNLNVIAVELESKFVDLGKLNLEHHAAKMTAAKVRRLRSDRAAGMSFSRLAAKYGLSIGPTYRIAKGLSWKQVK